MSLNIDDKGNIYIYKGDSGDIVVSGLPTDKNYNVYFTVKDLKNRTVASCLEIPTNYKSSVTFSITSNFSNMLKVPENEEVGFYFYGLKTVDEDGNENTLFVNDCCYGEQNKVIVFPPKVEVEYETEM